MKKTFFLFLVITLIQLGVFNISAQQKTASTTLYSKIDSYLTAGSKNGFSGAISVVKNGKTIINKGYGIANKDTQTLNNPNTLFLMLNHKVQTLVQSHFKKKMKIIVVYYI
jgi:CubicO group peptidase (beta-lactamase class C family)